MFFLKSRPPSSVGVIFCSFSHAVQNHPELVERYLGTVVPPGSEL